MQATSTGSAHPLLPTPSTTAFPPPLSSFLPPTHPRTLRRCSCCGLRSCASTLCMWTTLLWRCGPLPTTEQKERRTTWPIRATQVSRLRCQRAIAGLIDRAAVLGWGLAGAKKSRGYALQKTTRCSRKRARALSLSFFFFFFSFFSFSFPFSLSPFPFPLSPFPFAFPFLLTDCSARIVERDSGSAVWHQDGLLWQHAVQRCTAEHVCCS